MSAAAYFLADKSVPTNAEEHVKRIELLGERINSYIQFMCQAVNSKGCSAEMVDKALAAFYKQVVLAENQLRQISDEFRLQ